MLFSSSLLVNSYSSFKTQFKCHLLYEVFPDFLRVWHSLQSPSLELFTCTTKASIIGQTVLIVHDSVSHITLWGPMGPWPCISHLLFPLGQDMGQEVNVHWINEWMNGLLLWHAPSSIVFVWVSHLPSWIDRSSRARTTWSIFESPILASPNAYCLNKQVKLSWSLALYFRPCNAISQTLFHLSFTTTLLSRYN